MAAKQTLETVVFLTFNLLLKAIATVDESQKMDGIKLAQQVTLDDITYCLISQKTTAIKVGEIDTK
jgi:hypothetical protein